MTYAVNTDVPADRSRAEIERILTRYRAGEFAYGWKNQGQTVSIGFAMDGRHIRLQLDMPDRSERRFTHHSRGLRSASAADQAYEQATRQRWRALALVIKAKLEAVEAGISTIEKEFLADTVMPNGRTVYDWAGESIRRAIDSGLHPAIEYRP